MSTALDGFLAGWAYGAMSVLVGQPFETLKTRMQVHSSTTAPSLVAVAKTLYAEEGVRGLYRGGTSLFLGGAVIRSTQFGVNGLVLGELQRRFGQAERVCWGTLDPHVVLSGLAGGVARGLVESPFEYVKVKRQVDQAWKLGSLLQGSGATVLRNSFLFSSFVIYMDCSKQIGLQLSPFWLGASCASLAWLTIWPLDVVKTQLQAGAAGQPYFRVLRDVIQSGALFRGLAPGMARSSVSNGCAMVAYKEVERLLRERRGN